MGRGGFYEVVTTGTPEAVRKRQNLIPWIVGGAVGITSAVVGTALSGLAGTVVVVVVALAIASAVSRWFVSPVSPHLTLEPEDHEQLDALLARGGGPATAELRTALTAGRLSADQLAELKDIVHAERERLWTILDDDAVDDPPGTVDDWAVLRDIDKRLERLLR